jgi:hypothetical protein
MHARVLSISFALATALLLSACSVFGSAAAPEPEYTVLKDEQPYELRVYSELVIVRTSLADGQSAAFGRLFDYISGANAGAREIAMTAPVLTADENGTEIDMTAPVLQTADADSMIFVLTDDFTYETAPVPTDKAVELDVIPARQVAVLRFSGSFNQETATKEEDLRTWLAGQNLVPSGQAERAGYNPPWTIPAFRRNEILIPVVAAQN